MNENLFAGFGESSPAPVDGAMAAHKARAEVRHHRREATAPANPPRRLQHLVRH